METQIRQTYDILRSLVLQADYIAHSSPEFWEKLHRGIIESKATDNQDLLKLAILSSHAEWEGLYGAENPALAECLGDTCRNLAEEGLEYFGISWQELGMLRKEVLYGDPYYPDALADLADTIELHQRDKCFRSLWEVAISYALLERNDDFRACLDDMNQYLDELPEAPLVHAMLTAEWLGRVKSELVQQVGASQPPSTQIIQVTTDLLAAFEANEELNRVSGYVSPLSYINAYIASIRTHLELLEAVFLEGSGQAGDGPSLSSAVGSIIGRRTQLATGFDQDFFAQADDAVLDLMKKHDDLLLSLLDMAPDPAELYYCEPILRGTRILIWQVIQEITSTP